MALKQTELDRTFCVLRGAFDADIVEMFQRRGFTYTNDPSAAGIVVYSGGEDINPAMYGEKPHRSVYFTQRRDDIEEAVYEKALRAGLLNVGICRGAQLLNVKAGGKLWQDVDGHGRSHVMHLVSGGKPISVTSMHHQVMRMAPGAVFQGYGEEATRFTSEDGTFHRGDNPMVDQLIEVEACYYPKQRSICYQPHPEIAEEDSPCVSWFFDQIEDALAGRELKGKVIE